MLRCVCSKYEPVIGSGSARELFPLADEDGDQQSHRRDTFALQQLVHPLQSTTASALIPYHQVIHDYSKCH